MEKEKDTGFLETFGELLKTKCHQDEPSFCTVACPFHLDIKAMVPKWESGRWNAAYRSFETAVAFPAIVSRLCQGPCEKACILKERGGALSIREIERAAVRLASRKKPNAYNLPAKPQKVAVIGAGLSGLGCALRLCNKKYRVSIYERETVPGGSARSLMDPAVFDEEIKNQFQFEKPDWHLGTEITSLEELRETFDAVYVATGKGGNDFQLKRSPEGAFASDVQGVFLGGGLVGADEISALAQGIRAAQAVERCLKTGLMNQPEEKAGTKLCLDPERIPLQPALRPASPEEGYSGEEASQEALRCRKCSCDLCVRECDLLRIQQKTPGRLYEEAYITVRPSTLANDGRWATRRIASCDQCGLCRSVCPQKIDLGAFLLQSHRGLKETGAMPWAFHDFWLRDLDHARKDSLLVYRPQGQEPDGYALFPGCQMSASDPECVKLAYEWMREKKPGSALWMNCCGAPAVWAVEDSLQREHVQDLRRQWEDMGKPTVVFTCPSCRKMFDQYLPEIPGVFLEELLLAWGLPRGRDGAEAGEIFAVFDPCASRDNPGLQKAVREIADRLHVPCEELSHTGSLARCCSFGGQYSIAAPDYARRVVMERTEESPLPYITYCSNCRDIFASRGKKNVHILDLVFGVEDPYREAPTWTARRKNRRKLKEDILSGTAAGGGEDRTEEIAMQLEIDSELERRLSERYILNSDMEEVVAFCEREGRGVRNEETGRITGHKKLGNMTYWAEYEPLQDGTYRLWNGYAHRMNLEKE